MTLLETDLNELPSGLSGLLYWASQHFLFCVLDGSDAIDPDYAFPTIIAVGSKRSFEMDSSTALTELDTFLTPSTMGYVVQIGYGFKDRVEHLTSRHADPIGFPVLFVFEPTVLIRIDRLNNVRLQADDAELVWRQIQSTATPLVSSEIPAIEFQAKNTRESYLEQLKKIQSHIRRGDCYEMNYCQEYFADDAKIDPLQVYQRMRSIARAPFSCLYRKDDRWLLGASPERFLKKEGNRLESRPMKGTAPRHADEATDRQLASDLQKSQKDRSENIMVVDLVRNDLSRVADRASVVVDSLCALHSFPQVHQLVSTVSGRVGPGVGFSKILQACFPMGSMTGAPKVKVMELTDRYESSARGLYSGSIGFMEPNGDFDLNVVIRSLQYNATSKYLSYHVGSGITIYSDPGAEWEECEWKSAGIRRVFGQ